MRHTLRFIPKVESLEQICLLTAMNIASFKDANTGIKLDSSDSTGHTAWAFPGMVYTIHVQVPPQQFVGWKTITYSPSGGLSTQAPGTEYTSSVGSWQLFDSKTDTSTNTNTTEDMVTLAAPKDPGNVTITIDMVPYVFNPQGAPTVGATVTDSLTLKVQSPTVGSLALGSVVSGAQVAPPMFGGYVDGTTLAPNPNGTNFALMLSYNGTSRDYMGMWATIANNTHYSLYIGWIQIIRSFSMSETFFNAAANPQTSTATVTGADGIDGVGPTSNSLFYQGLGAMTPATTSTAPVDWAGIKPGTVTPAMDCPQIHAPLTQNGRSLTKMSYSAVFDTHLAVIGGWMGVNENSPVVAGEPISLGVATWNISGNATGINTGKLTTTLQAGSGVNGNGGAGGWNSPGSTSNEYLTWSTNAQAALNNASGIFAALAASYTPRARVGRDPTLAINSLKARSQDFSNYIPLSPNQGDPGWVIWDSALGSQPATRRKLSPFLTGPDARFRS